MTTSGETRQRDFLETLLRGYEAEGFTVFVNPSRSILPSFMKNYRPDAIAIKSDKRIAVEVKTGTPRTRPDVKKLRQVFEHHPDWDLRVFYVPARSQEDNLEAPSAPAIKGAVEETAQLARNGHLSAALVTSWANLEAISRALLPHQLGRPQPASSLIEVLATQGILTPQQADLLRQTAELRNAAAHGDLNAPLTQDEVDELISITRSLADLLEGPELKDSGSASPEAT